MAITSGFFNSVDGDRVYNADQMSEYFDGIVANGVAQSVGNGLFVSAASGMTVNVLSGRAFINCKWFSSDGPESVTITAANAANPRYTAVVVRLNLTDRVVELATIDGAPAASPSYPTIASNELCLAMVYVGAGATSIIQTDITDMRASSLCGYVTGVGGLKSFTKHYTWSTATTATVTLDMSGYTYADGDVIDVYINGLLAVAGTDYTINTTGASPVITTVTVGSAGVTNAVDVRVYKSGGSGSSIVNGDNLQY